MFSGLMTLPTTTYGPFTATANCWVFAGLPYKLLFIITIETEESKIATRKGDFYKLSRRLLHLETVLH